MATPYVSSSVTYTHSAHINTIDALLGGSRWTNSTITYSFPISKDVAYWSTDFGSGYGVPWGDGEPWNQAAVPLTSKDQINFEQALQRFCQSDGDSPGGRRYPCRLYRRS